VDLVPAQFGVAMEISAQIDDMLFVFGRQFYDCHWHFLPIDRIGITAGAWENILSNSKKKPSICQS
jgi:hypothetical protein